MSLSLTHTFVSAKSDDADTTLIRPSNWNAEHTITAAACSVLGRASNSGGAVADIAASADGQFLRRASGALGFGAIAWSDLPDGVTVAEQVWTYTTNADVGTVAIPQDDTIPQNTEGTEIFNQNWTPKSTTNRLVIEAMIDGEVVTAFRVAAMAIFQDSTANCLRSLQGQQSISFNNVAIGPLVIQHEFVPGTTSTIALKLRVGVGDTNGLRLNGWNGGRIHGGSQACTFRIREVKAS